MSKKKKDKKKKKEKKFIESPYKKEKKDVKIEIQKYSNSELSCRDISPEHCEELRTKKFTNDPKEIFLEVRSLEEQYKHSLEVKSIKWRNEVQKVRKENREKYKIAYKNKENELLNQIAELKEEIERNIASLQAKEHMILAEIDLIYQMNKEKLVDKALDIIGLNF